MIQAKEIHYFRKGNDLVGILGHGGITIDPGLVLCPADPGTCLLKRITSCQATSQEDK